MTKRIFITTIRVNLRSIVFWVCTASVILFFADGLITHAQYTQSSIHKYLTNYPLNALSLTIPIFIGVISSVDILRDRKNSFLDITKTTGTRLFQYFFGKILAYMLLAFLLTYIVSFANLIIVPLISKEMPIHDYSAWQLVYFLFVKTLLQSIPVVLVFTALGVCVSLLTKSTTAGIVATMIYAVLQYLISYSGVMLSLEYFMWHIYKVPQIITMYVYNWDKFGYSDKYFSDFSLNYANGFSPTLSAFGITGAIAAALFLIAFVRLKHLNDK